MRKKLQVVEVGPRDGFQNIKEIIPLEYKLQTIRHMLDAGVTQMEIGSFVSPKAIPQMSDMKELTAAILGACGDTFSPIALIPNVRGAEMAVACGLKRVTYVVSVSERHNMANVGKTPQESMEALKELVGLFPMLQVRVDLATAFGCPYEGRIAPERVVALMEQAMQCGVREFVFCDTIGVALPAQVETMVRLAKARAGSGTALGLHLHDTRGLGLTNAYVGIQNGIDTLETSVAGLGGCPFAPGAAGNTATEDLLYMARGMGMETGIDFEKYLLAVQYVKEHIQRNVTSRQANLCVSETQNDWAWSRHEAGRKKDDPSGAGAMNKA